VPQQPIGAPEAQSEPFDDVPFVLPAPAIVRPAEDAPSEGLPKQRKPGPGFWAALGWLLLYLLLQAAALMPFVVLDRQTGSQTQAIAACIAGLVVGLLLPAAAWWGHSWRLLAVRGIRPAHLVLVLALVLPMMIVNIQMAIGAGRLTRTGPRPEVPQIYRQLDELPWPLLLLLGSVLPAVGEETFFRGFLGRGLVARRGVAIGMGLTALVFGLLHFDSMEHAVGTLLLGLWLHTVFLLTKTLAAPVLLHAANNAIAFGIDKLPRFLGVSEGGGPEQLEDPPLLLVVTAAIALLATIGLLYQMRTRWLKEEGSAWSPGYTTAEMPPAGLRARPSYGSAQVPILIATAIALAVFAGVFVTLLISL
jgi:membrane protease YdiL (CAAX protease family)